MTTPSWVLIEVHHILIDLTNKIDEEKKSMAIINLQAILDLNDID